MDVEQHLREASGDNRIICGAKETVKRSDEIKAVVFASNTPDDIVSHVTEELGGDVDVQHFDGNNSELGSICGKPFTVSTVGITEADESV